MKNLPAILNKNLIQIKESAQKHYVEKLYVFGSATTPGFNAKSDLDFLVSFGQVPLLDYADNYFELQEELQKITKTNVDLVVDKSLKNPYLKNSIDRSKILLYG